MNENRRADASAHGASRWARSKGAIKAGATRDGTGGGRDSSEPDEAIAERAKRDPVAFGILYQRHLHSIYNYIYYRVGNTHDTEDLTARTFFRALDRLHTYEVRDVPFAAWLFRIAHNLVANWHRDTKRRKIVPLDELSRRDEPYSDPTNTAEEREEHLELRRAIAGLARDRQQLLVLKFVKEMPNVQIARAMGRSEGAVKALLHRTLVALREELAQARRTGSEAAGTTPSAWKEKHEREHSG